MDSAILFNNNNVLFSLNKIPTEQSLYSFRKNSWIRHKIQSTFKLSPIKCPEKGRYQPITINDKHKDQFSRFGYIRRNWSECGIDDHLFSPEYLIRIISGYYLNERVHIFSVLVNIIKKTCMILSVKFYKMFDQLNLKL